MAASFVTTFRLAAPVDVPALALLYAGAARALGPVCYSAEQVAAWAGFGSDTSAFRAYVLDARTWIAEVAEVGDGAPAGFCGVSPDGEVHSLYVRAGGHRRGLGSALLAHALADARGRGLVRFEAWVTPLSRPVFERAGFVLTKTVTETYAGLSFERFRVATPMWPQ